MPTFGICTSLESASIAKATGWDFIEENVQGLLQGDKPDDQWQGLARYRAADLPAGGVPAANCLVPGSLKITGPAANLEALRPYMANVCRRAQIVGMKTLVFGSGGARQIPEGCDRAQAREQILAFLRMAAPLAAQHDVVIVVEHLNRKETNVINSVAEAMTYVRAVNHPAIQCLVDSWHFWLEDEPLESLAAAMPFIRHVHLADKNGRVAPGQAGSDYRPFFAVIKAANYTGRISVEASFSDLKTLAAPTLAFIKEQWAEA